MSIATDILRSYVRPRQVLAHRVSGPVREDRALAILLGACALIFVAQWPRLSREAFLEPAIGLEARMAGALFVWILVMPLVFYGLSLLIQCGLRLLGSNISGFQVRTSLFWGLLASTPLWLLSGLMLGFAGPGPGANLMSALSVAVFLVLAIFGLGEAGRSREEATP